MHEQSCFLPESGINQYRIKMGRKGQEVLYLLHDGTDGCDERGDIPGDILPINPVRVLNPDRVKNCYICPYQPGADEETQTPFRDRIPGRFYPDGHPLLP